MENKKRNKTKRDIASLFFVIVMVIIVALGVYSLGNDGGMPGTGGGIAARPVELTFSDVLNRADEIKTMRISGATATGTMTDGARYSATIAYDPELLSKLAAGGTEISIDASRSWLDMAATFIPLAFGVLLILWLLRGMRGGAAGIGRQLAGQNPVKVNTGNSKTTFKDVAGIESEKQELMEIVDFLRNKDKYKSVGARVPRGVLLSGQPGTGKTLLARAIAGEARVPFFAVSGSDFSGIIVGLGVAKMKEIFSVAKRNAPCILFIDEIDAIGQRRSNHAWNDQDREQTLNQLLIEMDGFANDTGIIVLGATNRADMLDPALLRPGRFDRQVHIELPDLSGRKEILDLYSSRVKVSKDVNMTDVARGTTGFSGADLENLLNEAALLAVRSGRKEISSADIDEARDKILMGPRKIRKMRDHDKKLTAYHEAGHAFVSITYADTVDPVHKATIVPRGRALGMVQHLPIDEKVSMTISEIQAQLRVSLAGRAAESVFFGDDNITTGADSDIAGATRLARYAVTVAGLSPKIGLMAVNQVNTLGARSALENASDETARAVDAEIRAWLDSAYRDAHKLLTRNKTTVARLAEELLKRETLTGDEIKEIVAGRGGKRTVAKQPARASKKTTKVRKNGKRTGN